MKSRKRSVVKIMGIKSHLGGRELLLVILLIQLSVCLIFPQPGQKIQQFLQKGGSQPAAGEDAWLYTAGQFQIEYTGCSEEDAVLVCRSALDALDALKKAGFTEKHDPGQPIFIRVYPDTESLALDFGWTEDTTAMGAYLNGVLGVLAPSAWMKGEKTQEKFDREGPVLHELTHLMVDEMTDGHYNRWWTEGMAQYMEKQVYGFQMQPPLHIDRFCTLKELEQEFHRLNERQAYWQALMATEYIQETYTGAALLNIMRQAAETGDFQDSLTTVLDRNEKELEIGYQEYIQKKWGTGWRVEKQPITH